MIKGYFYRTIRKINPSKTYFELSKGYIDFGKFIGYYNDKSAKCWIATELHTGLMICIAKTRAEVIEKASEIMMKYDKKVTSMTDAFIQIPCDFPLDLRKMGAYKAKDYLELFLHQIQEMHPEDIPNVL